MAMQRFRAAQLWPQPTNFRLGRFRGRMISAAGTVGTEFTVKLFDPRGRATVIDGRIRNSTSTLTGSVQNLTLIGGGGYQLQVYWKFQYDLDIGAMFVLSRIRGAQQFSAFKVAGLSNVIQCFDLVPPSRGHGPYSAVFRNIRGDDRPNGAAAWEWAFSHSQTVRSQRSGPSIITTTEASLPLAYRGSLSAEVSAAVGAEMGWDLGPAVTGSASAGAAAGASVDLEFHRTLGLRLLGNVGINATG